MDKFIDTFGMKVYCPRIALKQVKDCLCEEGLAKFAEAKNSIGFSTKTFLGFLRPLEEERSFVVLTSLWEDLREQSFGRTDPCNQFVGKVGPKPEKVNN